MNVPPTPFAPGLLDEVRNAFAHIESCPYAGRRVYFENAGGALTLKKVVETSAALAAIPDNQSRANKASTAMMALIDQGRADMRLFLNAVGGMVFVGESGTEVLFRMIRAACRAAPAGAKVLGSTLEHPASRSAAAHGADIAGLTHELVAHDPVTGTVTAQHYAPYLTPDLAVATIVHASPVTGMVVDVAGIAAAIRAVAPDCLIIVDGIQFGAHGCVDVAGYGVDAYAISPYKMFARHGYGVGWVSDRLQSAPHDRLVGGPDHAWELGTRDVGAYATFSDVVHYLQDLGERFAEGTDRRSVLQAAGHAIAGQEASLLQMMVNGIGNLPGLSTMERVQIIGGADNPARAGLVSLWVDGLSSAQLVDDLGARGICVHIRKNDHYCGNVLGPLQREDCIRVSLCHYNTPDEVRQFLGAMAEIVARS